MEDYDWYNEVGYKDSSELKPGVRVLYEEHALFPELDELYYQRLRSIRLPVKPAEVSPRGFVKIASSDQEWHDPRNRNRRIYEAVIHAVLSPTEVSFHEGGPGVGIQCIVDVLGEG
jgi:hypothetical protein